MSKESLDKFIGWEQSTQDVDFFGSNETVVTVDSDKETVLGEQAPEKPTTEENATGETPKPKETDNTDNFFGEGEQEGTSEVEETLNEGQEDPDEETIFQTEETQAVDNEEEEEESPTLSTNASALSVLKDKGYLDYELEEGEELTEEKASEILEDKWDESLDNRVKELFDGLPEAVKQLNRYAIKGGDIGQFFNTIAKSNSVGLSQDMDLSKEENQEKVVRQMLKEEGEKDDAIQIQIDYLKESNKLKNYSESKFEKWKQKDEAERKALVQQQEQQKQQQKANLRKAKSELASTLKDLEEINGFTLTRSDKKELPSYMVDRNIKLSNGNTVTPMQRDLMTALQDPDKATFLAKLLREDFDLKDIKTKSETKVAKQVKDSVRRSKQSSIKGRSTGKGSSQSKRSLADFF